MTAARGSGAARRPMVMRAAQAGGSHWGLAAKACLAGLGLGDGGTPGAATAFQPNLGVLYVTQAFADDLSSIVTFLRETTPVANWVGAVGHAVFGPEGEVHDGPSMALLAAALPDTAMRLFDRFDPAETAAFETEHGPWLDRQTAVTGLVHGDPREPAIGPMVTGLAAFGRAFLVGGLTVSSEHPSQVAGRVQTAGLSGILLGEGIQLATGLAQGCTPIGGMHRATEVVDNVIMAVDGRPALEVLKAEAGEIIARDLQRAAGYIHVGLPVAGSDSGDYLVRSLMAIDPKRGWIAIGDHLDAGDRLMFVHRDANAAQKDFKRMLAGLARRLEGRRVAGGIYVSCVARGPRMFGEEGREIGLIHDALGDFPLVGFAANGEICHDRLYGFTGVLALFLDEAAR